MYNFLVTGLEITSPRGSLVVGQDRLFLHTNSDLVARYAPSGSLDEAALMALPLLVANESSSDPKFQTVARVGTITRIRKDRGGLHVEYVLDLDVPPIPNCVLESLAPQLNFVISTRVFDDFHTNHWAVKDADLFRVLFTESIGHRKPTIFKLPEGPISTN